MIAQRFRPVWGVAAVAVAATLLYSISLKVASERTRLEEIDRQIAETRRDIRELHTEMGTRASLRQLERWNGETLALSAPGANQYLNDETGISEIGAGNLGSANATPPPVFAQAAVPPTAAKPGSAQANPAAAKATPAPAPQVAATALSAPERQVQQALNGRPATPRAPVAIAARDARLLEPRSLAEISRAAKAEAHGGTPRR